MELPVRRANPDSLFRHRLAWAIGTALLLGACGNGERAQVTNQVEAGEQPLQWSLQEQGGQAALILAGGSGGVEMRMICSGKGELQINVPSFRPVGSEERMTFGQGSIAETLVADPSGDSERGGVTASGSVPENLKSLISGEMAANYGAQDSGPHPPLPPELASRFVNACRSPGSAQQAQSPQPAASENISECLVQDGTRLEPMRLHAVGTEPFWAGDIKGRCVTYSTPENIDGTRIWTKFDGSRDRGVWTGYYQDKRFVLRTYPDPDCSDGMSDKVYPVGVTVAVGGEERAGCAEYK